MEKQLMKDTKTSVKWVALLASFTLVIWLIGCGGDNQSSLHDHDHDHDNGHSHDSDGPEDSQELSQESESLENQPNSSVSGLVNEVEKTADTAIASAWGKDRRRRQGWQYTFGLDQCR